MKKGERMSNAQKQKISRAHKSLGENHWAKRKDVREKMSKTWFVRGQEAWNKGVPAPWAKGRKAGFVSPAKGVKRPELKGFKHPNWKGDQVGMGALHRWVYQNLGSPMICEDCGLLKEDNRHIHWANFSGKYKRDLKDWRRLCVSCHHKLDKERRKIAFRKKRGLIHS